MVDVLVVGILKIGQGIIYFKCHQGTSHVLVYIFLPFSKIYK